jgi:hypothetical protein
MCNNIQNGGYLVQTILESKVLNPVYIEKVDMIPSSDYVLAPPSNKLIVLFIYRVDDVFDNCQTMNMKDKKFYTQVLKRPKELTANDLMQAHKLGTINLGHLQVTWISSFDEKVITSTRQITVRYGTSTDKLQVSLMNAPAELYVEEPQSLTLKITNVSGVALNLKLFTRPEEAKAIPISSLSKKVIYSFILGSR